MKNIKNSLLKSDCFYGFSDFISSRRWNGDKKNVVLCDISPESYRPFYLGANIIDAITNQSEFNCGRAIWQSGQESMEWFTESPVKSFEIVAICAYMYYQIFGIPAFLANNKIQPLSANRKDGDPIIILGGQMYYLYTGYNKFVDIACIGEGEEFIIKLLKLKKEHTGSRKDFLIKAANIPGAYVPSVHDSDKDFLIKKTFLSKEKLQEFSKINTLKTKHKNNVIEVARGCKYACGFCSLHRRMFPFREIDAEVINQKLNNYPVGAPIYPFAPDEASYAGRKKVIDWCKIRGLNVFHYNYRLDTIQKSDVLEPGLGGKAVLGIDGISQRVINIVNKQISLDKLINEIAPEIFKNGFNELKLNYVFNFPFEKKEDYDELFNFWKKLIELRIKLKSKCFIHIAPTPFLPEYFIPLQFFSVAKEINPLFEATLKKIKTYFFDELKIEPRIKAEGLQGYKNWITSIILHRVENLSDLVLFCYKNGVKSSHFSNRLYELCLSWLRKNNIAIDDLLKEIDPENQYWFDKIDWSGGLLNHKKLIRNQFLEMKRLSEL